MAPLVREGRGKFLSQFPSLASPETQATLPDPADRANFERCRLDWSEREKPAHALHLALHRDLLALRRTDPVLSRQSRNLDGAVLSDHAFVIRYFSDDGFDRLLLVNLGPDLDLAPAPEPLLAEPTGAGWELQWCSESPLYGGLGIPSIQRDHGWFLPKHSAAFFVATPAETPLPRKPSREENR